MSARAGIQAARSAVAIKPLDSRFRGNDKQRTYWVALSGGLDSTALLHRLHAQGLRPLRAIHVHHGLQKKADRWAADCRAFCKKLKMPFTLERVTVPIHSVEGPESAARNARYAALRKHLTANDWLVTAHHRDDQAETVLLRLLRGSGVEGLAAMRPLSDFPPGKLWRPLLDTPRSELLAYAKQHRLTWIEDPHNRNPRYARSWLREAAMPLLCERYPALDETLARTARHCAEALALLRERAEDDLRDVQRGESLSVTGLLALGTGRRRNLLRHWVQRQGLQTPNAELLEQLDSTVLRARAEASPLLGFGDHEWRRYRDGLYLIPALPPSPGAVRLRWNGRDVLTLPAGCGVLKNNSRRVVAGLTVRFPQGGESLKPTGHSQTRTLKNLFQQAGVPPWLRPRTPLVYAADELMAVAGRWHSTRALRLGLKLEWRLDEINP